MAGDASNDQPLAAGDFGSWLGEMEGALRGDNESRVPCDGCTACCSSFQFVHIGPEETEALSHIPDELMFPAPGLPRGHVVLGYDERGRCPMLIDDRCSIYEHRPRTCRTYDCRVFPAAGLDPVDDDKVLIATRARRWRFSFPTRHDRVLREAVRAAATFLREHDQSRPDDTGPTNATRLAVLAIEAHGAFLQPDEQTGHVAVTAPDPQIVRDHLARRRPGPDTT